MSETHKPLAKYLTQGYHFSSQQDRDEAMRMAREIADGIRAQARESSLRMPVPSSDPLTVLTDDFDTWWAKDGRYFDPDTSDVPWYDKRKELAEYAYRRGKLVTTRWAEMYKGDSPTEAADLLTNTCQILDVVKQEWGPEWSEWDQSVREGISAWLKSYHGLI